MNSRTAAIPDRNRAAAAHNGQPRPIAFPARAQIEQLCRTRANADNQRWQEQVERRDALVQAAAHEGYRQGERAGYTAGWHWGVACGIVAGGVAVGLLWIGWAPLQGLLAGWLA